MDQHLLSCPDLLAVLLSHLTRQDGVRLALTCRCAARSYSELHAAENAAVLYTPAPRVVVCTSGNQQLASMALTPTGQPYLQHAATRVRTRRQCTDLSMQTIDVSDNTNGKRRTQQWLTGLAFCPYDKHLYIAAYGAGAGNDAAADGAAQTAGCGASQSRGAPASILRFSPGTLRPTGCLVSGPAIHNPEGIAFAKQTCYVASAGHAAVLAVALQDGSIQQRLALAGDAVPWGMAAWDPSTYPLHAVAAQQQGLAAQHDTAQRQDRKDPQSQQRLERPHQHSASAADSTSQQQDHQAADPGTCTPPATAAASGCVGEAANGSFHAQAARGCLLVAVQADVHKADYWAPPAGAASGSLVCVPLSSTGRMLGWREWSRVKIKRPSGVTVDHAGHVWTTSLEQLLLRLAGPCHANHGCLMQRVDLVQLLPRFAAGLYPMDVQAAVRMQPAGGANSSLLAVTVHAGPRVPGAVAVLRLVEEGGRGAATVVLVACWQHHTLQQPNMLALQ